MFHVKHDVPESYIEAKRQCSLLGVDLQQESYERLIVFVGLLEKTSKRSNLIGPSEMQRVWSRHILESIAFVPFLDRCSSVIDIGTGAGFPGMVLSICNFDVVMVEPRGKRIAFLETAARLCGVTCNIIKGRIEEVGPFPAHSVFTSRAVKKPEEMVKLISPSALNGFTLITRVSTVNTSYSNATVSKELPIPPVDRSGFILQYRHQCSSTTNSGEGDS